MNPISFFAIDACNMCGNPSTQNKIIGERINSPLKKKNKESISITVFKCNNCGYLYANPQPVYANTKLKYKTTTTQDYWKTEAVQPSPFHYEVELKTLKSIKNNKLKGLKVLDIGFGLGRTLHTVTSNEMDVYGIEPYETFFNHAKNNANLIFDRNKIECKTFEDASFESNQFDIIIFEAFQHIVNSNDALKKSLNWLKPNGLIQIEVANANWLIAKLINLFYKLKGTANVTNLSPLHAPYNQHEFTLKSFIENAKKNNYKIVHVDYYICNPYFSGILGKLLSWYMKKTNRGMQFSIWITKN